MGIIKNLLDGKQLPLVMGIINATPDSFYYDSRKLDFSQAVETAVSMVLKGADIIDIGAESTRPGSSYIDEKEELNRLIPVLREIRKNISIPISIDTRKGLVAKAALDEGADIINDVSSLNSDLSILEIVKNYKCDIIIMHMWAGSPREITTYLETRVKELVASGIERCSITVDPGFGFGKGLEENLAIINQFALFKTVGLPVMAGCSRKTFVGKVTDREVKDRLPGTLAAEFAAIQNGADILRVHDVGETVDIIKMWNALKENMERI